MNEPIQIGITTDHLTVRIDKLDLGGKRFMTQLIAKHDLEAIPQPNDEYNVFLYGKHEDLYFFLYDFCYHYDILLV